MKRMHIHIAVKDISESVRFYSTMFGEEPSVVKNDYAKWMLDDPRVNFAVSTFGRAIGVDRSGIDHLGIQVETPDELREIAGRLKAAQQPLIEQRDAACCYARSDKAWATDPVGVSWETFFTMGETTVYGEDLRPVAEVKTVTPATACCAKSGA